MKFTQKHPFEKTNHPWLLAYYYENNHFSPKQGSSPFTKPQTIEIYIGGAPLRNLAIYLDPISWVPNEPPSITTQQRPNNEARTT